jgi:MFS family permease
VCSSDLVGFGAIVPLRNALGGSWRGALGIWGFGLVIVGALWILLVSGEERGAGPCAAAAQGRGLYLDIVKRREIRLLSIAFMCDFACYSYTAAILPTLLREVGHLSEAFAGVWAAVAFPAVGIVGALLGGAATAITGKRKSIMAWAQIMKFVGISIAAFGAGISLGFTVAGISIFGLGNSIWMPAMYAVPMELEGMDPPRVGAAFAFITACGFVSGFIAPVLGGLLTSRIMAGVAISDQVARHVIGLKWSLFPFGFANLVGFICILLLSETGPSVRGLTSSSTLVRNT